MGCYAKTIFKFPANLRKFVVIGCLIFSSSLLAQQQLTNFGSPLDIPWQFSSSFAELRANAFHGGVDFRTQQREGLPVFAVADGTLTRVVVSATGFGNALYISHANGIMSVYAHLSRFIPEIERVVRAQHYARESFELNLTNFQALERIQFRKGDLIGWSGNTGSSMGPHLHFELRNQGGTNALNPKLFGFAVRDDIPPIISTFAVYPNGPNSLVNGRHTPLHVPVTCRRANCSVPLDTIRVFGNFAFGIEATDRANDAPGILGLHTKQVFLDDELKFAWRLDAMPFSHMRFINAFIDFAHFDSTGQRIQWTYVLPGNRLNIYEKVYNRGIFSFLENGVHNLRIEAADFAGNTSVLNVILLVDDQMESIEPIVFPEFERGRLFSHMVSNTFQDAGIRVVIPPFALYEPIHFEYSVETSTDSLFFSNIHHVHRSGTPVHTSYTLSIRPVDLPRNLQNKALIGRWDRRNEEWAAEGGRFENGFVTHNIRRFGTFAVFLDTVAPEITPVNVQNNIIPATQNIITFEITDDFSGIESYRATINGRWFLMEFDAKSNTLRGTLEHTALPSGEHNFVLTVTDRRNNRTTYQAKIIR
ncbi:MAG: M23 family metallopeptidase [Bacteroidales bacterium]|nr:M23 family metallopeptidase [Bacteroidales bacterium]